MQRFQKKLWMSEQGVQQQHQNQRLQEPSEITVGVSATTLSQDKLIFNKVVR